jgi:hypothetical protein
MNHLYEEFEAQGGCLGNQGLSMVNRMRLAFAYLQDNPSEFVSIVQDKELIKYLFNRIDPMGRSKSDALAFADCSGLMLGAFDKFEQKIKSLYDGYVGRFASKNEQQPFHRVVDVTGIW